jgi:hypothetical protein
MYWILMGFTSPAPYAYGTVTTGFEGLLGCYNTSIHTTGAGLGNYWTPPVVNQTIVRKGTYTWAGANATVPATLPFNNSQVVYGTWFGAATAPYGIS